MSVVMIHSSFYSEYELYRVDNIRQFMSDIKALYEGEDVDMDIYELLGSQDSIDTTTAIAMSDSQILVDDLVA